VEDRKTLGVKEIDTCQVKDQAFTRSDGMPDERKQLAGVGCTGVAAGADDEGAWCRPVVM
jgi:hypothetical protein